MSGFPIRPTRGSFGPKPQNRRPTRNPEREMDADLGDLLFWQTAGNSIMVPLAWVLCEPDDGGDLAVSAHAEAWNPNGGLAAPDLEQVSAGVYDITYANQYPDKDGAMRALNLAWAIGAPQVLSTAGGGLIVTLQKQSPSKFRATILRSGTTTHEDRAFAAAFW